MKNMCHFEGTHKLVAHDYQVSFELYCILRQFEPIKRHSIKFEHLVSVILTLECKCDAALNLYRTPWLPKENKMTFNLTFYDNRCIKTAK